MKKGETWISVVLYIALGTIVLTIVLAAGMPVINKLRDKNIISETKDVFHQIDETVRTVINEGPGSQRIRTVQINKGLFQVRPDTDSVGWSMETKYIESEPGVVIKEGSLDILSYEDRYVIGKYWTSLNLTYFNIADIQLESSSQTFTGRFDLVIRNDGVPGGGTRPIIKFREKG